MTTFWKSLHRMTQDQLFTHGYLAPRTSVEIATKRVTQDAGDYATTSHGKRNNTPHWPRLAMPH